MWFHHKKGTLYLYCFFPFFQGICWLNNMKIIFYLLVCCHRRRPRSQSLSPRHDRNRHRDRDHEEGRNRYWKQWEQWPSTELNSGIGWPTVDCCTWVRVSAIFFKLTGSVVLKFPKFWHWLSILSGVWNMTTVVSKYVSRNCI